MDQAAGARAGRARALGVAALVIGVLGALVLWLAAGRRYDHAVADLAPAPAGCATTLVFDRTGAYTFFVETKGRLAALDGDCVPRERRYDRGGDPPSVDLDLVGPDGPVDVEPADGPSYDRDGAAGTGVGRADITATGEYTLTVDSDVADVVVRVGRDPGRGVLPLRLGAGALMVTGVGLGALALARSRPRPPPPGGGEPFEWPVLPTSRPLAPPYADQPATPPYAPAPGRAGSPLPPPQWPPPRRP